MGVIGRENVIKGMECCVIDGGCGACPYDSFKDCQGSHPTPETLMKDALALLKAQEPMVMDVTEVSACEVGTVLWVEERQGVTWNLFPLELETSSTHPDTGTDYVFFITYHDIRKFERSEYNQTWRCWTSRPDEKRRAETPWN